MIDPPYNTGSSAWNYSDNVDSPMMRTWLASNPVNADDLLRHDKWLCMMMPRLKLVYELMADGALIAVTIDNNELHNLWTLLEEIFGEECFVACAPWLSEPSGGREKTGLRTGHEYVLIFSKGESIVSQGETFVAELNLNDESGPYSKGRELRKWGGTSLRSDREGQWFALTAPDGSEVWPIRNDGKEGHWRWGKNNPEMKMILEDWKNAHWEKRPFDPGVRWNKKRERWVPYEKIRSRERGVRWSTWLDAIGYNADGTRIIKEIFGEKVFDTPKPVSLIEWLISLVPDDAALVLDSFAGSGTTAHAVLNLNAADDGSRRFLLVEQEDYADSITAERVRRVINGYEFKGVQHEELYRENITFTRLKAGDKLLDQIAAIENLDGHRFASIKKEIKDGVLTVTGENNIEERAAGLGGAFTYCVLGDPLDLDKMLTGDHLPDYEAIGAWLFHTATGEALDLSQVKKEDWFLGESKAYYVWLIYKPDLNFLKSRDAALTLDHAQVIAKSKSGKRHLVFGPSKFVPNKMLLPLGLEYAPLPFALYKLEKDQADGV